MNSILVKGDENAKKTENRPLSLINDQNGTTGNNFWYGFCRAKRNSCEVIAVHNAKVLLGMESTLSKTMFTFQMADGMWMYGVLGSYPQTVGKVLWLYGMDHDVVSLSEMTEPGVYIMSFWNDNAPWNGLHTVAIRYDGINYIAYNYYGDGETTNFPSLQQFADSYICGYYLR